MNWSKKLFITLLILPLAGAVLVSRWVNKILGKDKNPFQISEAEAQDSCWVPPPVGAPPEGGGGEI
ncbi:hypothetical protein A2833_02260 [Candidatus Azambacteria bacterium RIFCSPHIGHO2_01_FULL_44_55]|uniref:Uncharacterized protein n=1 Tax=Candidatus Azambacteria bacterium RIFCSPLOWO2_02_FULL_44_14 TaxID=1797306 RepID=A0A1F5CCP4_9BACT|nr:MAG: hypothetical protein A3A18_01630 [Candidatus Azambacteria bacterium RIFCSPLOWO2_01_FULL_44_84]OGD32979.1 MAG: hypothetical protein A3C78_00415 [Candidatus Azambacteria bacterium RIFCSPHIGHO2_02_FULL_45_18]OGD40423.1 MAG: hypothetical protein A2833_02260 [Candidatus Azambacteria bacterium RIFCSPHIGHO2_01_FULL_44_55]OGD40635.1 MAG: hypothetical protein A3I30_01280 [Candidatus Azambacteria bacterium RIFCSPLOWO2_02_FULL_44_14]OGD52323.1 MAG: hypothetical protein A2608_00230 [Candidatus Azam